MKLAKLKIYFLAIFFGLISLGSTQTTITVFTIGDSTMSIFSLPDLRVGWAQVLSEFFTSDIKINDAARSGRSSKSFIDQGYWNGVINQVKAGDYVVIQFGHNDEKTDAALHTDPYTTYTANLKKFIDETKAKGGNPILCTSIVRRYFNSDGTVKFSHGNYPDAVRKLAIEMNIPMVDMELKTKALVESFGPDSSKQLYNYVAPGVSSNYPNGNSDDTHLNKVGAQKVAELFVDGVKELQLDLASYIKTTGINDKNTGKNLPGTYSLSQNYPNPFNPSTIISYRIAKAGIVTLKIYDLLGREIATLVDGYQREGSYDVAFNGQPTDYSFQHSLSTGKLTSGVYFYRIQTDEFAQTKKMIFMK